jgi:hypothetical protein
MNKKWILFSILLVLLAAALVSARVLAGTFYDLSWWTVAGGGTGSGADSSSGGPYSLGGTIGQPDVVSLPLWAGLTVLALAQAGICLVLLCRKEVKSCETA